MSWAVEFFCYETPELGWRPFAGRWGPLNMVGVDREKAIELASKLARHRHSRHYTYRVRPWRR